MKRALRHRSEHDNVRRPGGGEAVHGGVEACMAAALMQVGMHIGHTSDNNYWACCDQAVHRFGEAQKQLFLFLIL